MNEQLWNINMVNSSDCVYYYWYV